MNFFIVRCVCRLQTGTKIESPTKMKKTTVKKNIDTLIMGIFQYLRVGHLFVLGVVIDQKTDTV